jgi:hypothetical protein
VDGITHNPKESKKANSFERRLVVAVQGSFSEWENTDISWANARGTMRKGCEVAAL